MCVTALYKSSSAGGVELADVFNQLIKTKLNADSDPSYQVCLFKGSQSSSLFYSPVWSNSETFLEIY